MLTSYHTAQKKRGGEREQNREGYNTNGRAVVVVVDDVILFSKAVENKSRGVSLGRLIGSTLIALSYENENTRNSSF